MKTTDAFRTAVISMQKNMLSIARKLTLNEEEAYDLVQDTTLKALDNESKYVDKSNFGGWIMTIMRNIFVNNYHRRAREVSIFESSGDLYNLNIPGETVMESPDGSFAASQIDEMIKTFPEDYRKPFEMHSAGYKYVEISERLNMPIGTVKSRIFTIRKQLRELLSE